MARYCNRDVTAIYEVVAKWKDKCLLADGSILSDDNIWTIEGLDELTQYFTNNFDEGDRNFLDKLEDQLKPALPTTKKLAAEMMLFLFLFISKTGMKGDTKRTQVKKIWSWSGDALDMSIDELNNVLDEGVGNPGIAYNTRRFAEFSYFIDIVKAFKTMSKEQQIATTDDPWIFSKWLDTFEQHGRPQLRHIIKFLLFPDYFERIATGRAKREIVNTFHNKNIKGKDVNFTELDKEVYEIRKELEEKYGTDKLDFYLLPLKEIWKSDTKAASEIKINTNDVISEIAEIDEPGEGDMSEYPNNLIFYGPPGTGKTYTSMDRAVRICDGKFTGDRKALVSRFKELQNDKRISFVTFHQSYSYEDFVEGIRPVLAEGSVADSEGVGDVQYECRPGVFRTISTLAKSNQVSSLSVYDFNEDGINIWKMSLGDSNQEDDLRIFDDCIKNNLISLGKGKGLDYNGCNDKNTIKDKLKKIKPDITNNDYDITSVHYFKNLIKLNDLVIISDGNLKFRAIGRVTGEYNFRETEDYNQTRSVEWLVVYEESLPYEKLLNKRFVQKTLYNLSKKVLKMDALKKLLSKKETGAPENHVLIIDEINRGNIAKIFGELITLLEIDKRLGAENELTLTLPYSGDDFGVPKNLFIIGTMNTADRSIALLDTALRRRFEFEELMPDSSFIKGSDGSGNINCDDGSKINLRKFLTSINQRINFMLNRDQTIGHAYLINVKTFDKFKLILKQQIIPLLQEYFYEDWHRIQLVFRDVKDGNEKNNPQIIQHSSLDEIEILGYDHEEYDDGVDYSVVLIDEISPEMIRKVYD